MNGDCLDFRGLPGQHPLFLDFHYNFEKVKDFYYPFTMDSSDLASRLDRVRRAARFDRAHLVESLRRSNQALDAGAATLRWIDLLAGQETVAVVTGQQVGLFGGPAYAVYKAATAIKVAAELREAGVDAVPVFWMASNDSDFEEVRSTTFVGDNGELIPLRHRDSRGHQQQSAGTAPLEDIGQLLETVQAGQSSRAHGDQVIELLSSCYRPGSTFSEGFGRWLQKVFQQQGLIVFNSLNPEIRGGLGDFFPIAVQKRDRLEEVLLQRSQELESNQFSPQVYVSEGETLLFWVDGSSRFKLTYANGHFEAKGRRSARFSPEELIGLAREEPQRFGYNALLRPILQDYIFPTAAYIGGPSEVAYFAQVQAIAPFWEMEPAILPRASFTIVDRKSQRLLTKHELTLETVLLEPQRELAERVVRGTEDGALLQQFDALSADLDSRLEELKKGLAALDPPLADMLENAGQKIRYQIEKVNHRFVANYRNRSSALEGQLRHLSNRLHPDEKLQERVLNFNQFLMEEGLGFVDRLIDQITPDCRSHRVWNL